jgi:predicted Fe-Mo cluster-binding NifX family protein
MFSIEYNKLEKIFLKRERKIMDRRIAVTIEDLPQGKMRVANNFGHCSKFVVFVINENNKVIREESYKNFMRGKQVSSQLPNFIYQLGANAFITGGIGHQIISKFENYNIQVVNTSESKVVNALYGYLLGKVFVSEEFSGKKVSSKN